MAPYRGFIGVSDTSQSLTADAEDLINWYYVSLPQNAKSRAALYPSPGFSLWQSTSDIGGRALFTENGRTFAVMGSGAYEFFQNATSSRLFTVTQDSNPAQIVTNGAVGAQALFSSGTNAYSYNLLSAVNSQVLSGDATMIGMLDGYGIAFNPSTSKIRISDLNDFTVWDPTQFAQRSAAPDNWKAMLVNAPDIWLIGEKTGDIWYDAGTFPFPLAPRIGLSYKYGISAPFTLSASGASVFWLSRNEAGAGIVVRTRGYSPEPVSSDALETAIAQYQRTATITDAEGFIAQWEGHTFYVLHFPSVPQTWGYDINENKWFKLGYWNAPFNRYDLWKPRVHTYAYGMHITADRTSGTISVLDVTVGTETDGNMIRRVRVAPGIFNEHKRVPIRNIEVYLEAGLGTVTGQGVDPVMIWQTSDDGGHVWAPERNVKAGKIGEYQRRLNMWRMGMPRDRVNKLIVSDPIPWRIVDAFINNYGAS